MATEFDTAEIAEIKQQITAINTAIRTILTDGVAEYRIDTGQTSRRVSVLDLADLRKFKDSLVNELRVLEIRCDVAPSARIGGAAY